MKLYDLTEEGLLCFCSVPFPVWRSKTRRCSTCARLCGQFKDVDSTTLLVLPQEPTCPGSEEVRWCRQDTKAQCQHGCAHLYVRVWVMILLSCDRTNGRKVILVFVGAHYILIPAKGFSNNGDIENILQGGKGIKFPGIPSCSTTDKLKRLNTNFFI